MMQQDCDEVPEFSADDADGELLNDDAATMARQQAMADAKRRLQEAEMNTALKGVVPKSHAPGGLAPKQLAPPSTETFRLNKVKTPGPQAPGAMPTKTDRAVPQHKVTDVREAPLSPGQYSNIQR